MNRARNLGIGMGSRATWEAEALEQQLHASFIFRHFRVRFAVGAIEVRVGNHDLTAVTWAFDVEHVQIILVDQPIQMGVDEVLPSDGAPVAERVELHIA